MKLSYSPVVRLAASLLMIAGLAGQAGCARKPETTTAASDPGEKRFPLVGEVDKIDPVRKVVIVTHDEIKGFMMGMTMEFKVASPSDLEILHPGEHIRAELVVRGSELTLEKIWPDDAATQRALAAASDALVQDTVMRGKEAYREIGETLPEFTLLNQDGQTVPASRFRGKQIVLNFIYTRCPIANMCPAATLRMAALQKAARAAGVNDLELVSISFDPENDTPGVLKEYARVRSLDTSNWSFLTGPDSAVRQLLAQLGIIREFDGPTIKHTLATVLINEQGKIAYRVDGSSWTTEEFVRRMKKA